MSHDAVHHQDKKEKELDDDTTGGNLVYSIDKITEDDKSDSNNLPFTSYDFFMITLSEIFNLTLAFLTF